MGDGWCHGNIDSDGINDRCNGDGDGTHDGDASAMAMDGAKASVVEGVMTTALDDDNGNATAATVMKGLAAIEEVEDYKGICFMTVKRLDAFICRDTSYAEKCGSPLVLTHRKVHFCGSMLREIWRVNTVARSLYLIINIWLSQMWLQMEHVSPVSNLR